MFACIGRILCGFIAQYLGVGVSVNVFATSGGTIFWWTPSAIAIAAMLLTPDKYWPERVAHIASGVAAYVPFRYKKFSVPLLASVCVSNCFGQAFAYISLKYFYPILSSEKIGTLRFLGYFLLFPVILASVAASIPGSIAFYIWGGDVVLSSVIVNYTLGHVSGTASLLYPLLITSILWNDRPRSYNPLMYGASALVAVTFMCVFTEYHLFGFAAIVAVYGIFVGISAYVDQCYASIIQLACTCSMLGLTAAGRGPFVYVIKEGGTEAVLIGTQMGITALVAISAFIVILVSELRYLEKSERDSRRRTEELAEKQTLDLYRIGHDMKNNSTLVRAVCEVRAEDRKNDTLEIIKAINLLNGVLVSDMVDMVSGKNDDDRVVSKEDVDIVDLVNTYSMVAEGLLFLEGKEKYITVRLQFLSSGNAVVYTNRERLHQIVCNLVSNAVKYTERGEIVLGVDGSFDSCTKIHVADSGIGLSEADVSRVFDMFFRSEHASEINSGTGMGLANVRNVCHTIDAKIEVSSPGEGEGSMFTLILPRKCPGDDPKAQVPTHFSLRVLVMDDSLVIRKLMTKYLTSFGCEVVDTSSAEESRVLLCDGNTKKFDLVITDNYMGEGELGPDFIRSIRKGGVSGLPKLLPCILCSGEHYQFNDSKTFSITKPFSSDDIAFALNLLTSSSGAEFA